MVKLKFTKTQFEDFLKRNKIDLLDVSRLVGVTPGAVDHWFLGRREMPQPVIRLLKMIDKYPGLMEELKNV